MILNNLKVHKIVFRRLKYAKTTTSKQKYHGTTIFSAYMYCFEKYPAILYICIMHYVICGMVYSVLHLGTDH